MGKAARNAKKNLNRVRVEPDYYFGDTGAKTALLKKQIVQYAHAQKMEEMEFNHFAAHCMRKCQKEHSRFYGLDNKYKGNGTLRG